MKYLLHLLSKKISHRIKFLLKKTKNFQMIDLCGPERDKRQEEACRTLYEIGTLLSLNITPEQNVNAALTLA